MKASFAIITLLLTSLVHSAPITISSYDIENANKSGTVGWSHSYSGTKIDNTKTINYSGGSGTLNDGIFATSASDAHLFNHDEDYFPTITLYLDGYYSLGSLLISGGDITNNGTSGRLNGLTVTIGSVSESFTTIAQGMLLNSDVNAPAYADDFIDFSGSSLDGLITNQITLSGFESSLSDNMFSIAEITLETKSHSVSVPEPTGVALFGLGLVGFGLSRAAKRAKH